MKTLKTLFLFSVFVPFSIICHTPNAFASPATKSACEAAFSKVASGLRAMNDITLVTKQRPGLLEEMKKIHAAHNVPSNVLGEYIARTAKEIRDDHIDSNESVQRGCGLIPMIRDVGGYDAAGRYVAPINRHLEQFIELGILTTDDLLDEGKNEL